MDGSEKKPTLSLSIVQTYVPKSVVYVGVLCQHIWNADKSSIRSWTDFMKGRISLKQSFFKCGFGVDDFVYQCNVKYHIWGNCFPGALK